jgi:hypothetical protein
MIQMSLGCRRRVIVPSNFLVSLVAYRWKASLAAVVHSRPRDLARSSVDVSMMVLFRTPI